MDSYEYPINVYSDEFCPNIAVGYQTVADLGAKYEWNKLIETLQENKCMVILINTSRLPDRNGNEPPPSLFTPLHYAADGQAPREIFEALLKLGASKCLKTSDGETAYDIGKRKGLDESVLELINVPRDIKQKEQQIQTMEAGLHQLIKRRAEELIDKNGQQLPQLSLLFEKGNFYYPVPCMYGGFSVEKHNKGICVYSWSRICGGSEQMHLIDEEGKVTFQLRSKGEKCFCLPASFVRLEFD